MVSSGLQPQPDQPDAAGQFLTFIVPSANGCNLKCSFCLIRQRREIAEIYLSPDDLARFIREAAVCAPLFALAVQGYEPLLPESLPFTQAILGTGRFLGIPASLVTNGTKLADAVSLLAALAPSKIAVSLDAASADIHDRIRGLTGAWAAAVRGIRIAVDALAPSTRLIVSSVLLPSRRHYLDAMPSLLREIGIDRWIINPLLRVGGDQAGGPVADRSRLFRDLLILQEAARREGIRLTVDDEFDHLGHDAACVSDPSLRALHVRTLPTNVEIFRLTPNGQCSVGDDILKQETFDTPRWVPGTVHAGDFLEMLRRKPQAARRQRA
ncbi:MAG TPA: radical SAM protein [Xanthobacteraceae bacterium]|jgi:MoaA/NifB/PqqE/SkfB family radical SAM enzyme|nr:radical SAM protein [Xanthobacteraceae bacterium]